MLTRIYTPPIRYSLPTTTNGVAQPGVAQPTVVVPAQPDTESDNSSEKALQQQALGSFVNNKTPDKAVSSSNTNTDNVTASLTGMATVTDQANSRVIQLSSVLDDLDKTMAALGVPASVKQEVAAYTQAIQVQARGPAPSTPLIQHLLKTSADSVDRFIGEQLGQPSKVVAEWMKALFLQRVAYKLEPAAASEALATAEPELEAVSQKSSRVAATHLAQIKPWLNESKTLHQAGQFAQADDLLRQAQEHITEQGPPQLVAKLWTKRAQIAEAQKIDPKQAQQAVAFYQKALKTLDSSLDSTELPSVQVQQAKLHTRLAGLLEEQGHLKSARTHYTQAFKQYQTLQNPIQMALRLNDLGMIQNQLGERTHAAGLFERAYGLLTQANPAHPALVDILSNRQSLV